MTAAQLAPWPPRQGELFERGDARVQELLDTVRGRFGARAITLGDSAEPAAQPTPRCVIRTAVSALRTEARLEAAPGERHNGGTRVCE